MALEVYTNQQIADYLKEGYWSDSGKGPNGFDFSQDASVKYMLSGGLSQTQKDLTKFAISIWSHYTGIEFVETDDSGQYNIFIGNRSTTDDPEAHTEPESGRAETYIIQIDNDWYNANGSTVGSYTFQTILHEIGHALGLGHPGDYNDTAVYAEDGSGDNHYLNDSWRTSIMSYFNQLTGNTWLKETNAHLLTPMVADLLALRDRYGLNPSYNDGDTSYDIDLSNTPFADTGLELGDLQNRITLTYFDTGGIDTFDFSQAAVDLSINLTPGEHSDIGDFDGAFSIDLATYVENAIGGSGADHIIGNDRNNHLQGGAGDDILEGKGGSDTLDGGTDEDTAVFDGTRSDWWVVADGADYLVTRKADDKDTVRLINMEQIKFGDSEAVAMDALELDEPDDLIEPDLPDLIISNVNVTGFEVPGGRLEVTWDVENQGNGQAGSSYTGIYLWDIAANHYVKDEDGNRLQLLLEEAKTPIDPGRVNSEDDFIFLPADLAAGSYKLMLVADAEEDVTESNEGNNETLLETAPEIVIHADYSENKLVDAIKGNRSQVPASNIVKVWFGAQGDTFSDSGTLRDTDIFSAEQIDRLWGAFDYIETLIDVQFKRADSADDADVSIYSHKDLSSGGWHSPRQNVIAIRREDGPEGRDEGWGENPEIGPQPGSIRYESLLHEVGHFLGIEHSHSDSGDTEILLGIWDDEDYDEDLGAFNLNQAINMVMSYPDGWVTSPDKLSKVGQDRNYGYMMSYGAVDIAALQQLHGVSKTPAGAGGDIYYLPTANGGGTGYRSIWDSGGTDRIQYDGTLSAVIDLRAASLEYELFGGGRVSYAINSETNNMIHGGFTIANGVVIENALGGFGADQITGNDSANRLVGRKGNDQIIGGNGNDIVSGWQGNDTLNGGLGSDKIKGGKGSDTAVFDSGKDVVVRLGRKDFQDTGEGWDKLKKIENLTSGEGRDLLIGNRQANILDGGGGNDVLRGRNGDDTIIGGAGNDQLYGGKGADRFVFAPGDGIDTVYKFGTGADRIDLRSFSLSGFADLKTHAVQRQNDLHFELDDATIIVSGLSIDQLNAQDFIFA